MAFLQSDVPFSQQQQNIAGALQGPAVPAYQGGVFGQQQIAGLLQGLSSGIYGGGTAGAFDIQALLRSLGGEGATTGTSALQQAQQIETTGTLPTGGQALVQRNLDEQTAAIKGKYAQLGESGSTAELDEINRAKDASLINQFTIAGNLGQILGQQGLGQLGQGLGSLSTAGSLSTTLAQLGLGGLHLTADDYRNLATEGMSALNIESGIYGDQAKLQIAQDAAIQQQIGSFFKALAGAGVGFAVGGPAGAVLGAGVMGSGGGFNLNLPGFSQTASYPPSGQTSPG